MLRQNRSETSSATLRRATNVTLPEPLLSEAKALGINISQACEKGLGEEVAIARRQRWLSENRDGIEAWNRHVADHDLPLAAYRRF